MTPAARNGRPITPHMQYGDHRDGPPIITIDAAGVSSIDIDRVVERYVRQSTAIAAQQVKTIAAISRVHELFRHGGLTVDEAFHFFAELDDTVQFSNPTQQLYDEHRRSMLQREIEAINALIDLGVRNIGIEVGRLLDRYPIGRRGGGSRSIFANVSLGARIGIDGGQGCEIIDVDPNPSAAEPKQRFDGFVVGQTGFGDEFGGLAKGGK